MNLFDRRTRDMDVKALTRADFMGMDGTLPGLGQSFSVPEWDPVTVRVSADGDIGQAPTVAQGNDVGVDPAPIEVSPGRAFILIGSNGQGYVLAELIPADVAGIQSDPFFTFLGDVPTAGVTLTVAREIAADRPDRLDIAADEARAAILEASALTGTNGGESLDGTSGDDTIEGLGGNDTITGQDGNDLIDGGLGDDTLDGGPGIDSVSFASLAAPSQVLASGVEVGVIVSLGAQGAGQDAGQGTDTLIGFENVEGTSFADLIFGDGQDNTLFGGAGGDVLDGGAGADLLYGGAGFDALEGGPGADAIYGGDGFGDIATYFSATGPLTFAFGQDLTELLPASSQEVTEDILGADLEGIAGATSFSNTFDASNTSLLTFFLGGQESDTFFGGSGVDQLVGLGGDDLLYGNDGVDAFVGEGGNDTYFGGGGGDFFFFDDLDDQDVIGDYEVGQDIIFFTGNNITSLLDLGFDLADGDGDGTEDDIVISYSVLGTTSTITVVDIQNEGDLTILFQRPNDPPVPNDQSFSGIEDTAITGQLDASDPDTGPAPLSFSVAEAPQNGQVVVNVNGTFTYTPELDFTGTDSFVYSVTDGLRSAPGTVTLTVVSSDAEAPVVSAVLANDTGIANDDGITLDPAISGNATDNVGVTALLARISTAATTDLVDISAELQGDGSFTLDLAELEALNGGTLQDGLITVSFQSSDAAGNLSPLSDVTFTLDREVPVVSDGPAGTLDIAPTELRIVFDDIVSASAFDTSNYVLTDSAGATIDITSLDQISDSTLDLNLASALGNDDYTLAIAAGVEDVAGNIAGTFSQPFTVDAPTRVISVEPSDGDDLVNLDRHVIVSFDRPVDPSTVTMDSFQVLAGGEALPGIVRVSSNGELATFFLEDGTILPPSTQVRIVLDGDAILDAGGNPVDVDGDGVGGGQETSDFTTVSVTRIPNTNVEGFIFDSNNRGPNGEDLPLEGVIVTVIGLPGVQSVTDENGRFFLEDMPFPDVYLHFDASPVTAETGFSYGTIVKPAHTKAGQTVSMETPDGTPFNIYFAAFPASDSVEITAGQATEAVLGDFGLQNLIDNFPDIPASEWEKLKVTVPEDSLFFDDGTPATNVTVMAFEPDRIPAPTPPGFDPLIVFTVAADGAENVDGKAQIEFPNLDGLALGEKRPILSFDHDKGDWVQTGTAIVVEDGNGGTILRSEGDTGVNTLGWKFVGDEPGTTGDPEPSDDDDFWDFFDDIVDAAAETGQSVGEAAADLGQQAADAISDFANDVADAASDAADAAADFYQENVDPVIDEFVDRATELGEAARDLAVDAIEEAAAAVDRVGDFLASEQAQSDIAELANIVADTVLDTASILGINPAGPAITAAGIPDTAQQLENGIQNGNVRDLAEGATELIGLIPDGGFAAAGSAAGAVYGGVAGVIATAPAAPATGGTSLLVGGALGAAAGSRAGLAAGLAAEGTIRGAAAVVNGVANAAEAVQPASSLIGGIVDAIRGNGNGQPPLQGQFALASSVAFSLAALEAPGDPDAAVEPQSSALDTLVLVLEQTRTLLEEAASYANDPDANATRLLEIADELNSLDAQFSELLPVGEAELLAANQIIGLISKVISIANQPQSSDLGTQGFHYLLENSSGFEVRGFEASLDSFQLSLQPNESYILSILDVATGKIGRTLVIVEQSNSEFKFGQPIFVDVEDDDIDLDGLGTLAERILGTSANDPDTDGDGIKDGAEVEQGLNPLDGVGFPTGVIASLPTQGEALDVAVEGKIDGSGGQTAYVATGSHGLAVIEASQFSNPIVQGEIDLAGTNRQVSVDAIRELAFVAAAGAGLHVVDVSDPFAPTLVQTVTVPGGISTVKSFGDVVLAGGSQLLVLSPATGAVLAELPVFGSIKDIAIAGDKIFAVVDNARLVSFEFDGTLLTELDSEIIPTPPVRRQVFQDFRIFVDDGVAYVSNGLDLTLVAPTRPLERGGYVTFDVSDASDMALISNIDTPAVQSANNQTITNGAGIAVVAAGQRGIQIHDSTDPNSTFDLITEIDTAGDAQAVALASGIAYVADGSGGLQVVNFLPFDANGIAPTIAFNTSAADADPNAAGIQIEEGRTITLDLDITDDVQVRNVELLLNGQIVVNDVSAPYDLSFAVPALSAGTSSIDVQVRATDTGGNSSITAAQTFDIIPDITPPELNSLFPEDGRLVLSGPLTFSATFNESIDVTTIDASNVVITDVGGALTFLPVDLAFLADDQIVQFNFSDLALGEYQVSFDLAGATDRAGNALGGGVEIRDFEVVDATAVWINPTGGDWNDTANWRDGLIPGNEDGVAIVLDDGAVVTASSLDIDVDRLRLQGEIELFGGDFTAPEIQVDNGAIVLNNGARLSDSVVVATGSGEVGGYFGTVSNVRVDGTLAVRAAQYSGSYLTVEQGLTVNGYVNIATSSARNADLNVNGSQTIEGIGEILLESDAGRLARLRLISQDSLVSEVLTIGSDLTLRGSGQLSANRSEDRVAILGDLIADGGALNLYNVDNGGAELNASEVNGGVLRITGLENTDLAVGAGSEVDLTGTHQSLTISGDGITHLNTSTVNGGLTIEAGATAAVDAVSGGYGGLASRTATVNDGLVIDGTLELLSSTSRNARLRLNDEQIVTGTGEILLGDQDASSYSNTGRAQIYLSGQQSGTQEILTLGADLDVRGTGYVFASQAEDRIRVLGDVIAEGGRLTLQDLDNGGAQVQLSEAGSGQLRLNGTLDAADLAIAGGIAIDVNATMTDVTVSGAGQMHLNGGRADGLSIAAGAEARLDVISGGYQSGIYTRTFTLDGGFEVDGTFTLAGDASRSANLRFADSQQVTGTGTIDLARDNVAPGSTALNRIDFDGLSTSQAEVLSFGAGITIQGSGSLYASRAEDRIEILGTVAGTADGLLTLQSINNQDALGASQAFQVDASAGRVGLQGRVENAVIDAASGQTGTLELLSGTLEDVDLNIAARIDSETTTRTISVEDGLTLVADLALEGSAARTASLAFRGTQTVDGTGEILMSRINAIGDGDVRNQVYFAGQINGNAETLTFGAGITLAGDGSLFVSSQAEDQIQVLGTVRGVDGGTFQLDDINNAGQGFAIDASLGQVALDGRIADAALNAAVGQTGRFDIISGVLETVTLNVDTGIDAITTARTLTIEQGLTLNAELSLEGVQNRAARLDFLGEQSLDGTGEIVLSRANALANEGLQNFVRLVNTSSSITETLTIGEDVTIRGQGRVDSNSASDLIDLKGTVRAEDGLLEIDEFDALDGTLGAASDGTLEIEQDLVMEEQGRLEIGVDANSTGVNEVGQITVQGTLERAGVLALDVGQDFTANLGDTFQFLTTSTPMTGDFQGFEGFDLDGNLAFTIDQTNANTLTLRVTTDAEAQADGVFNGFIPPVPQPFIRPDITLDVIDTTIRDSVITGTTSGAPAVEITSGGLENSVLQVDAIADGALVTRSLTFAQGATLNGTLTAAASEFTSVSFTFNGAQLIDGTGTIRLSPENALQGRGVNNDLRMFGLLGASEIGTFGEDVTIAGQGTVTTQASTGDALRILGTLAGEGTGLVVSNIDNAGAAMTVDTSQGSIRFGGTIRETVLTGDAGTAVDLGSGIVLDTVDLGVNASFGSTTTEVVNIHDGLTLSNGITLSLEAGGTATATLRFFGPDGLDGTGTVLFSTINALSDGSVNNDLNFRGLTVGREVMEIGAGITLRGTGEIFTDTTEDVFRILGTVAGTGAGFTLRDIDNAGGTLTIDSSAGQVRLDQEIANAVLEGSAADSILTLTSGATLDGVTLGLDAQTSGSSTVLIENGLTFTSDARLIAAGTSGGTSTLSFSGAQAVTGPGTVLLSAENAARNGQGLNQLELNGVKVGREVLSFDQDVTIAGQGTLSAREAEDRIQILGTVAGEGTGLIITDLDNQGEVLISDTSQGDVILSGRIENTALAGTPGSAITLANGVVLSDVGLDLDTALGGRNITIENGFRLDATLSFGGSLDDEALVILIGAQSVSGSGTLALDDAAATNGAGANRIRFDGVLTEAEALTFGSDLTLVGEGRIETVDAGDVIDLQGLAMAEGGLLEFDGLETLNGTLSAQTGARIEVENTLALGTGAVLEIAIDGDGNVGSRGRIDVQGLLTLGGTLRLDVGAGFAAATGDEFSILTTTQGFENVFAALEGFDFAGPQGFQLVEDGNALILRVVEGADIGTTVARADLPVDPPLPQLSGLIQNTTVDAGFAGGPVASIASGYNQTTFDNVVLDSTVLVQNAGANSGGYLSVVNGLTIDGALGIEGAVRRTSLYARGDQLVDGTGVLELSNGAYVNSARLRLISQDSLVSEVLTFGSDLTLRGSGQLSANRSEDRVAILGDLIADGGALNLYNVDNGGAELNASEVNGGVLRITGLENTDLAVGAGSEVDLTGTHQSLTISGDGITHLNTSTVNGGLTIEAGATAAVDAVSGGYGGLASRTATVNDGLVIDGTLELLSSTSRNARLRLNDEQIVTGTGEILLGDQDASSYSNTGRAQIYLSGQQSGTQEILTLGADLDVRGTGYVFASQAEDRIRVLGDVIAEGGRLTLQDLDNGGAQVQLSEAGSGQLRLNGTLDAADLAIAGGIAIDVNATMTDVTVSGAGQMHLNGGRADGLSIAAGAEARLDVISGGYQSGIYTRTFTLDGGFEVDGTFTLAGDASRSANLRFADSQQVTGTGTIDLARDNVAPGSTALNRIDFDGLSTSQAEVLSFGAGITIQGSGSLYASRAEDRIEILGTVAGTADGLLTLQSINNQDALGASQAFQVDASAGRVGLQGRVENAVIDAASGQTGTLELLSGTLEDVDLNIAARIDSETTTRTISVEDGLTLVADLALEGSAARTASLAFRGTQTVDGTGEILMSRINAIGDGDVRNQVYFAGQINGNAETLTFGAGITLAGDGSLFVSSQAEDQIQVLGTVRGVDGGTFQLDDINNAGQGFAIDASLGQVALDGRIADAALNAAVGQTGRFDIISGVLETVTLNVDTGIDAITTARTLTIEQGLTLNAELSLEGVQNRAARLDFLGEQSLDGTGEIVLSRANALANEGLQNFVRLVNTSSSITETLTIGEDVTIRGQGRVDSNSASDLIDLKGTVRAEDGLLEIDEFDALDGTLGAASDGTLEIEQDLVMEEQGRLEIGVDANSTGVNEVGQITVQGTLERAGVLALDVGQDFTANLGDTFQFLTTSTPMTGDFQGFEGFDLDGNLAFTIDQTNANTLTLRVTTDAEAQADGVFNGFIPPVPQPFIRPDITLDVIDTTIRDSVITGTTSGAPAVEITSGGLENSVLQVDAIADGALVTRSLTFAQGATLNGTLTAAASEFTSVSFTFNGAQLIDGTGTIRLSPENALQGRGVNNDLRMFGLLGASEIGTFGEDVTIAGQGTVTTQASTGDALRILGTLAGEGTGLVVSNIDNAGAAMTVDTSQGSIRFGGTIRETVLTGDAGTAVDLGSGIVLDTVDLGVNASFGSTTTEVVNIHDGLTLSNGITLSLEAGGTATATLRFFGPDGLDGTGTVLFSTINALSDGSVNNDLNFRGLTVGREVMEIGAGITLRGTGEIFTDTTEDVFRILGTVAGTGAGFTLRDIDNAGGTLTIDSSAGQVRLDQEIANAVLEGSAADSILTLTSGATLDGVTLGLDAQTSGSSTVLIENGLTFTSDARLIAAGTSGGTSTLSFSGAQAVTGPGTVLLSAENAARNGQGLNQLELNGVKVGREVLSFDQDVTIAGQGTLSAREAEDRIQILGTVAGEGTGLIITDLDNQGEVLISDTSQGDVILSGRIENTALAGTPGSAITLANGVVLSDVGLDLDTALGGRNITIENGFRLDATLSFGGSLDDEALVILIGAQSVSGSGTLALDDAAATNGAGANRIRFDGVLTEAEALTFGSDLTLVGEGRIETVDAGDVIDLQGLAMAEGGLLEFDGLETLNGTLSAQTGARIEVENTLALGTGAVLEIAIDGDGNVGSRGRIDVQGLLTLGGTLRLDVGAGFAAATGDEFSILTTTQGFENVFAALEGFDFAGPQGFQLVEDGNALILRVVEGADIGTTVARADLPVDPPLPQLSGLIQNTTVDAGFAGGPVASIASGYNQTTFDNVVLDSTVLVQNAGANSGGYLSVVNGLTIDGALGIEGAVRRTSLYARGDQLVDGTGVLELSNGAYVNSARLRLISQDSLVSEVLTIGSDLTLRGSGQLSANRSEDRVAILGDLIADGGALNLYNVDNGGAELNASEVNGGVLRITGLENTDLAVGAGSEVDLTGTHQSLTISGDGITHLNTSTVNGGLTIEAGATAAVDAVSGGYGGLASRTATVNDGLVIDGTLELLSSTSRNARLRLNDEQIVTGTGEILLGDQDASSYSNTGRAQIYLSGQQSGTQEILTLGADLDVRGTGYVFASQAEDRIRVLGDVIAEGGRLTLQDLDNGGAQVQLSEAGSGQLRLNGTLDAADLAIAGGIAIDVNATMTDVTVSGAGQMHLNGGRADGLSIAAGAEARLDVISGGYQSGIYTRTFTLDGGFEVDGTFTLAGDASRSANLRFADSQQVTGTGTIDLARDNVAPGSTALNRIDFDGLSTSQAEVLSFGAGITIQGSGSLYASRAEDRIEILGTVAGTADGLLTLQSINNQDALGASQAFQVDASAGRVGLQGRVENAVIDAASGQTGTLELLSGTLEDVDLNIAARIDSETTTRTISVEDGLTLVADLALEGSAARTASLAFRGTQTVDGTGEILMSRINAIGDGDVRNQVYFAGQINGNAETLTFGAGITLAGDGSLFVSSQAEDQIQVLGTVRGVDGGTFQLDDINNAGQGFAIDASLGQVALDGRIADAALNAAVGQTGRFDIISGVLETVTLNVDTGIDAITTARTLTIEQGLTLNAELSLEGVQNRAARLDFLGEQSLDGTGEIVLSRANALANEGLQNFVRLVNTSSSITETLTIGEDVTIRGQGRVDSNSASDLIDLKGTVRAEDGLLEIDEFDALDGTLGAASDGTLEIEQDLVMEEQGRLEIGVDANSTGVNEVGQITVQGTLERAGVLALDVGQDFTANLGDTFQFLTTSTPMTGDFQGFEGFDLDGNLAFTIDQTNANTLTLRVTTDAEAQADGVFNGFIPPDDMM